MKIEFDGGLSIEVTNDEDGFPQITIDTSGNYIGEQDRPALDVTLNGVVLHVV